MPPAAPAAVTVTPYGLMVYNTFFNTSPLANDDIPTGSLGPGHSSLGMTLRQSRFGLKVASPVVANALGAQEVKAQLELDFFGGFYTNSNITYTMSHPRLRLYYLQAKWKTLTLTLGQDWTPAGPLNPTSLNHVALPGFHGTGNLWNRLPQVRVDAKVGPLKISGAVLAPAGANSSQTGSLSATRASSPAELSDIPSVEARVAYESDMLKVGVSGHLGAERLTGLNASDNPVLSYAGILDLKLKVSIITLQGEAYMGQNANALFGVSRRVVAVDPTTGMTTDTGNQQEMGGWGQILVAPIEKLTLGGAFGAVHNQTTKADNMALYFNVIYLAAPGFKTGVEFDHLITTPPGGTARNGNQINATAMYSF